MHSDSNDVDKLHQRIQELEIELFRLQSRISFLENHPTLTDGIRGEGLIAALVNGVITPLQFPSDVHIHRSAIRIEVKLSRLNKSSKSSNSTRWSWQKVTGQNRKKAYDRLLLIGVADQRFRDLYLDPNCPYVFFDVPYKQVEQHSISTGSYLTIQLSTNPRKARNSAACGLFSHFQVTDADIKNRYGLS